MLNALDAFNVLFLVCCMSTTSPRIIARNLKAIRLHLNKSQQDVATAARMSLGRYNNFEATGEIKLTKLLLVAAYLGRRGELLDLFNPSKVFVEASADGGVKPGRRRASTKRKEGKPKPPVNPSDAEA